MHKRFIFHILILSLYFIIISGSMLTAQDSEDKLVEKYLKLKVDEEKVDTVKELNQKKEKIQPTIKQEIINIPPRQKDKEASSYFGYDYFLKRESISLYDNLPVPVHYQFGPGDEIIINIWGDMQLQSSYIINKDGNVYIDELGQLSIVGKTILEAENSLKIRFEAVFSTMGGANPSTFFDLSIGKLKSININIIGEVASPGMHSLHPFSTISTALVQSGGIDTLGTLRSIKLTHKGGESVEFDFYNFFVSGKIENDVHLKDGDVIFVKIRNSSIIILGEVKRQGIYELKDNENFGNLLSYCGGLKISAQDKISINRIIPLGERQFEDYAHELISIESSDLDFHLRDGDKINIISIYKVDHEITISGRVKNPGTAPFYLGMTLMDLLQYAGGINDKSFKQTMDLDKVELVRRDSNMEYPIKFDINVNKILNGDIEKDMKLKNWDIVHVRRNANSNSPELVDIIGEVKSPGSYTLLKRVETLEEIITRSGGYTDRAHKEGIKILRGKNQIILKNFDIPLLAGDSIIVPKHTSVVEVTGAIYHPGYVQYIEDKSVEYYIDSAGGFTTEADKNSIMVIYANGDIDIKRSLHKLRVTEGSNIVVQRVEVKEEFNLTEFLQAVTSILASLATIVFIVTSN